MRSPARLISASGGNRAPFSSPAAAANALIAALALALASGCLEPMGDVGVAIEPAEAFVVRNAAVTLEATADSTLKTEVIWTLRTVGNLRLEDAGVLETLGPSSARWTAPPTIPAFTDNYILVRATSTRNPDRYGESVLRVIDPPFFPPSAPTRGGDVIRILLPAGFDAAGATVEFDGVAATEVELDSGVLKATTPARDSPSVVDVRIETADDEVFYPASFHYSATTVQFSVPTLEGACVAPDIPNALNAPFLEIADLDGCGTPEILALCRDTRTLTVSPSENRPGWSVPWLFDLAGSGGDISVADLDGDGFRDVVMIHPPPAAGLPTITVLINQGRSEPCTWLGFRTTQSATIPFTTSVGLSGLADFDGDGNLDVAYLTGPGLGPNAVNVLRGLGTAFQTTAASLALGPFPGSLAGLAAGDADGDGLADLVLTARNGIQNQVILQKGNGATFTFSPATASVGTSLGMTIPANEIGNVAIANVDADAAPEIVAGFLNTTHVAAFEWNAGVLVPQWHHRRAFGQGQAIRIGDFDGDGTADVFAWFPLANATGELPASTLWGPIEATAGLAVTSDVRDERIRWIPEVPAAGFGGIADVAVGDLNGDGAADRVISRNVRGLDPRSYFRESGVATGPHGEFSLTTIPATGVPGDLVSLGMVDNLSRIAFAVTSTAGRILVVDDPGGVPVLTTVQLATTLSFARLFQGDVTQDGVPDLIAITRNTGFPNCDSPDEIWIVDGRSLEYRGRLVPAAASINDGCIESLAVGDADGDGRVDLVVGTRWGLESSPSGSVGLIRGSQHQWIDETADPLRTGEYFRPVSLQLVDLDGDHDDEILFASRLSGGDVEVFERQGPIWSQTVLPQLILPPRLVFAEDVDGDGRRDVIVVMGAEAAVTGSVDAVVGAAGVFRNLGFLEFAPPEQRDLNGLPTDGVVQDVDADGNPDLVVLVAFKSALVGLGNRLALLFASEEGSIREIRNIALPGSTRGIIETDDHVLVVGNTSVGFESLVLVENRSR